MFLVTTKNTLNSINRTKSKETDFDLHKIGFFDIGRDDRIRTCGILLPKQARYQTALHPVNIKACHIK
jgi:hypothetical protein